MNVFILVYVKKHNSVKSKLWYLLILPFIHSFNKYGVDTLCQTQVWTRGLYQRTGQAKIPCLHGAHILLGDSVNT